MKQISLCVLHSDVNIKEHPLLRISVTRVFQSVAENVRAK